MLTADQNSHWCCSPCDCLALLISQPMSLSSATLRCTYHQCMRWVCLATSCCVMQICLLNECKSYLLVRSCVAVIFSVCLLCGAQFAKLSILSLRPEKQLQNCINIAEQRTIKQVLQMLSTAILYLQAAASHNLYIYIWQCTDMSLLQTAPLAYTLPNYPICCNALSTHITIMTALNMTHWPLEIHDGHDDTWKLSKAPSLARACCSSWFRSFIDHWKSTLLASCYGGINMQAPKPLLKATPVSAQILSCIAETMQSHSQILLLHMYRGCAVSMLAWLNASTSFKAEQADSTWLMHLIWGAVERSV